MTPFFISLLPFIRRYSVTSRKYSELGQATFRKSSLCILNKFIVVVGANTEKIGAKIDPNKTVPTPLSWLFYLITSLIRLNNSIMFAIHTCICLLYTEIYSLPINLFTSNDYLLWLLQNYAIFCFSMFGSVISFSY